MPRKKHSPRGRLPKVAAAHVLMEGTRSAAVPNDLRRHSLIQAKWFYTLPMELWNALLSALGRNQLDPELQELDLHLAAVAGCQWRVCRFP